MVARNSLGSKSRFFLAELGSGTKSFLLTWSDTLRDFVSMVTTKDVHFCSELVFSRRGRKGVCGYLDSRSYGLWPLQKARPAHLRTGELDVTYRKAPKGAREAGSADGLALGRRRRRRRARLAGRTAKERRLVGGTATASLVLACRQEYTLKPRPALPDMLSDVSIQQVAHRCRGPLKCTG